MTALRRRATVPRRLLEQWWPAVPRAVALAIAAILSFGCGGTTPAPATTSPSVSGSLAVAPSLTPVPGGSAPASSAAPVSQTDTTTEVGRIWDDLPPSFPGVSGAVPAQTTGGPTSGSFAVGSDLASAVAKVRAGLTGLGYNVDVGTPLEDGTVVLDAGGGENPDCRIEVRFTPLSGTTTMAVLYGASCPFT